MPAIKSPRSQENKPKTEGERTTEQRGFFQKSESGHTKGRTRITIKYDVGFSNAIYIRGKGANLSWDRGVQLKNINPDEWVWETEASFAPGEFKVLINDREYETGENHTLTPGAHITYTPKF